jgi:hypothetical protein
LAKSSSEFMSWLVEVSAAGLRSLEEILNQIIDEP